MLHELNISKNNSPNYPEYINKFWYSALIIIVLYLVSTQLNTTEILNENYFLTNFSVR